MEDGADVAGIALTIDVAAASLVRGCSFTSVGGGLLTPHTERCAGHLEEEGRIADNAEVVAVLRSVRGEGE